METWRAIDTLRVVRSFDPRPLRPDHLERILHAGRRTGSSKNRQDWTFIVVRDRARLAELANVGTYAGHLAGAAAAVALVGPTTRDRWDLGRAAQDMALAAWELGIGSVPATVYDFDLAARLLGLPEGQECPYLLSFGYPADPDVLTRPKRPGGRKALAEVVYDEAWGRAWTEPQAPVSSAAFDAATLARLAETREIAIETRAAPGAAVHRTIIWVVVEEGRAFVRSYRGPGARWYREALAHPAVVIEAGTERIAARALRAPDADAVGLCSFGLARKYAADESLPEMLAPGVLATTLRLEPA
jgi:nitroreductase